MTQPDPFSALLDVIAELKETASKLHADLVRGDKAMSLLHDLVDGDDQNNIKALRITMERIRAFLAASPAIPPGDGDA